MLTEHRKFQVIHNCLIRHCLKRQLSTCCLSSHPWFGLQVTSVLYNVTCVSADAPSLFGATENVFILFQQADGVRAGIDYTCHVTITVTAFSGTNLPNDNGGFGLIETQTSPISEKVSITTLEGRGKLLCRCCLIDTYTLSKFLVAIYMYLVWNKINTLKGALSRYCTITLKSLKLPMDQWKP